MSGGQCLNRNNIPLQPSRFHTVTYEWKKKIQKIWKNYFKKSDFQQIPTWFIIKTYKFWVLIHCETSIWKFLVKWNRKKTTLSKYSGHLISRIIWEMFCDIIHLRLMHLRLIHCNFEKVSKRKFWSSRHEFKVSYFFFLFLPTTFENFNKQWCVILFLKYRTLLQKHNRLCA